LFGGWVLGFGFWVLGPNPKSPIPNPQLALIYLKLKIIDKSSLGIKK
jgi:hypothetical protein